MYVGRFIIVALYFLLRSSTLRLLVQMMTDMKTKIKFKDNVQQNGTLLTNIHMTWSEMTYELPEDVSLHIRT